MYWLILLSNWVAKKRICKLKNIKIATKTKVQFRKISLNDNCTLIIEEDSIIEGNVNFDKAGSSIYIGKRVFIGGGTRLVCAKRIKIEDDVMISWGCTIVDHNSHSTLWRDRKNDVLDWFDNKKDWTNVLSGEVIIESKAWLGFNVVILKGVTVGEGAFGALES